MRPARYPRRPVDRLAARAERIGSAMEVWSSPDLRPLLERGRAVPARTTSRVRGALVALLGRRRATVGGLRAH